MPQAPYKFIDKRSGTGYSRTNTLYKTTIQNGDREQYPLLDRDVHKVVSNIGRRTLMTLGRKLFSDFPLIAGAILDQANLAVGTFIPQYYGRNKAWGSEAENWLFEWHKIMDFEGQPYDYENFLNGLVLSALRCGDEGVLLTETTEGYPQIQTVPAHRIGNQMSETMVVGGPYDGARIIDGVIVNDYGRPVAYRILGEDPYNYSNVIDVPAQNFLLSYMPVWLGQKRGFSVLGYSAFDWQDVRESRSHELLAQKVFSSRTITEYNETGDVDTAKAAIQTPATFDGSGNKTGLAIQKLEGGTYTYLRANSGSKLEAFDYNRPGENAQMFQDRVIRDAYAGMSWDYYFALQSKEVGGASMRVIVDRIERQLEKLRRMVEKACRRVDGYAIAKAVKLGLLPPDEDCWMWEYQGPARLTADRKYDSEIDLQETSRGLMADKEAIARRGSYWEDVYAQKEIETGRKWDAAKRLQASVGGDLTLEAAYASLWMPTPNGNLSAGGSQPAQQDQPPPAGQ